MVYALYDVGLVVCACIITTYFAPAAAGSGIPDVKGYLNGIDFPGETDIANPNPNPKFPDPNSYFSSISL